MNTCLMPMMKVFHPQTYVIEDTYVNVYFWIT